MKYKEVKKLKKADFKRYVGVHIETFEKMVQVVQEQEKHEIKEEKNNELNLENKILMTLQYLKEGRSFFHLALNWEIDEKTVIRTVNKIENILVRSGEFRLPKKKFKVLKKSGKILD
ncbi:transposase family protein [Crocosphaera sp.]|uniref:helix-turn-helix domain-containing protein n=1 Tax=Crocosphaera sp. TaxID=2729996 RepID=UPI00257B4ADC|nr:transposase family protein [Crocosphaera sp.]NQZ63792.1 transposase family protein [Crocosphaera sp.]